MEEIIIKENDANQRLDKFLQKTYINLPTSKMYKSIRNKKIKVNRKRCTHNQILNEGDHVLLFLPPEFLEKKEREILEKKKLDIIYEDENLLIVNKPAGLLSQSEQKHQDCLVSRIQAYLFHTNQWNSDELSFAPTICHRLDRNTCGLVIAAKNANTLRIVNEAISKHSIKKYYRTWVSGNFKDDNFSCNLFIKKVNTKAIVSKSKKEGFKSAKMNVHVLKQENNKCYCEIELLTGRFHQIRASLAYYNHPLIGDLKYGYKGKENHYFLQAYKLDLSDLDLPLHKKIIQL